MTDTITKPEITSKAGSVNRKDVLRGLLVGALSAAVWPVANFLTQQLLNYLTVNDPAIAPLAATAVSSFMAYIAKNFATGASQKIALTNSQVDAIQNGPDPEKETAK